MALISGSQTVTTANLTDLVDGGASALHSHDIAADSIVEAKLDVSNGPTNDYFLQAQSGEGGGLTWAAAGASVKVGTFTRDTATASGNQAITGVGFTPKALLFMGGQASSAEIGFGLSDGTNEQDLYDRHNIAADTWAIGNGRPLTFVQAENVDYSGTIASLDADGFTITWTRAGTPTGTLTIMYLAIG